MCFINACMDVTSYSAGIVFKFCVMPLYSLPVFQTCFPSVITTIIMYTGAVSVSEIIKINHTLQVLNISENQIGDLGIAAIAETLICATIIDLNVSTCGITFTGAKSLAMGLINNCTIKSLNVELNDITLDGSVAILEAAATNEVCREVWINYEYESDDKVKEIMTILKERKRHNQMNSRRYT